MNNNELINNSAVNDMLAKHKDLRTKALEAEREATFAGRLEWQTVIDIFDGITFSPRTLGEVIRRYLLKTTGEDYSYKEETFRDPSSYVTKLKRVTLERTPKDGAVNDFQDCIEICTIDSDYIDRKSLTFDFVWLEKYYINQDYYWSLHTIPTGFFSSSNHFDKNLERFIIYLSNKQLASEDIQLTLEECFSAIDEFIELKSSKRKTRELNENN